MNGKLLLTFNAGSSTVKIGVFVHESGRARRIGKGMIDFRHRPLTFHLVEGPQVFDVPLHAESDDLLHSVLEETFGWLASHFDLDTVAAVGHRVVHGGDRFSGPVPLDSKTIADIESLTSLAPLHQPQSLRLIRALSHLRPNLAQTASFDTAFHRTQPEYVQRFAIPRHFFDEGIKRYGFHGLSYRSIANTMAEKDPYLASGRLIVAHLGSGASLCGMVGGESRDTSMGFSTIDGVPMATRCGHIDPGVLFHMMGALGLSREAVEEILYHKSGLLGLSGGLSADSRLLLESQTPEAADALDVFTFRIAGEIARIATTIGGIDGLVFTAGIGENQPAIRAATCRHLAWLGIELDEAANAGNAEVISTARGTAKVMVIATDEEQVIADEALAVLSTR